MKSMKPSFSLTETEKKIFDFLLSVQTPTPVPIYAAGGWVRDKLLGEESDDLDIAVGCMTGLEFCKHAGLYAAVIEAKPDQSKHLETATAVLFGQKVEFTNLRDEDYAEAYENNRIPKVNKIGTPQMDAERRDYTINALLYDLRTGVVEDYNDGRGFEDLSYQEMQDGNWWFSHSTVFLCTPLEPRKTFMDDPLRILRGYRFLSKLPDSSMKDDVVQAIYDPDVQAAFKERITPERILVELLGKREDDGSFKPGLMCYAGSVHALGSLYESGLLDVILDVPAMAGFKPFNMNQNSKYHQHDVFTHTMLVLGELWDNPHMQSLPKLRRGLLGFACLLHDIGKRDPESTQLKADGRNSYHGHEDSSAVVARAICNKLKVSNEDTDYVVRVVGGHMKPHSDDWGDARCLRRFIHKYPDEWRDIIVHAQSDANGSGTSFRIDNEQKYGGYITEAVALIERDRNAPNTHKPIISGTVVMKMIPELKPNTGYIREVNAALLEMRLDRPETTEEEYLAKIVEIKPALLEKHLGEATAKT